MLVGIPVFLALYLHRTFPGLVDENALDFAQLGRNLRTRIHRHQSKQVSGLSIRFCHKSRAQTRSGLDVALRHEPVTSPRQTL